MSNKQNNEGETIDECSSDDDDEIIFDKNDHDHDHGRSDNINIIDDKKYFLGFEESNKFRELWQRLKNLVVRTSQILNAGMGLYYEIPAPSSPLPLSSTKETSSKSTTNNNNNNNNNNTHDEPLADDTTGGGIDDAAADATDAADDDDIQVFPDTIPEGSVLCFYTGHVHNHSSASRVDKSYLLWIRGDTLVTAGNMPTTVTARYINDPLNDTLINCRFTVTSLPPDFDHDQDHEDTIRSSVVATRPIRLGEELFIGYGDGYWKNQPPHIKGEILSRINLI
ncbi:hypothetical protein FRACYDRAFT_240358 [Fragilariopsis cylindrus CCMP1102]|uniref:Uncharacterized protein n=1 Tax=Fragilariopsis cylindrus CCMP1102 TaxID=635003 RepID=A0A1E7FC91_9STRA|nr:hypothetical protein FRACYDRAFT_240358 [Fragilariopsis cylindrus CCMP1102]|eukprot:OEU15665.1 hypothetical protein FRACYDRAFT_240358 [Fragilariopsis cylindrus CCMP1102]